MGKRDLGKPGARRIGLEAKVRFLEGLRAGEARNVAAAGSGFSWRAFYQVRRRDPIFEFAWLAALELSAVDERDRRRADELLEEASDGPIGGGNRRLLQRKARRGFSFDERRQQIFLDHFAGTADEDAAADAAGVSRPTVRAFMRRNPEFAALRDEALLLAYTFLEGEALRQRLEAQQRLRDNLEPTGEVAQEFERVMKLLARYDRKSGRIGSREHQPSASRVWSFEDSIKALDKALDSLGTRRAPFPPELRQARLEGPEPGDGGRGDGGRDGGPGDGPEEGGER